MALVPSSVRIIGTGLIGGSLGMALGAAGASVQVQDVSPGTTALAVELGVGHVATPEDPDPELVVVAAPPDAAAQLIAEALRTWPSTLVTDVASVRGVVLEGVARAVDAAMLTRYIGAHPMAGREVSGVISARGDLFRGRPFVVVPHATTRPEAVGLLQGIATAIGAVPVVLPAAEHDTAVAHVSHVPQVLSSLLATTLLDPDERALALSGQGLRDTTRIADSDPRLWVEILGANAAAVTGVLARGGARPDRRRPGGSRDHAGRPRPGRRLATCARGADRRRQPRGAPDPGQARRHLGRFRHGHRAGARPPGRAGPALHRDGEIGVNLEDFRLEHNYGRQVGLGHLAVDASREELLTRELSARGWTVAEA
ncbi:prephenate dehydrogenase [Brachybacterium sp. Z12]|uniref:prephenate dehydrogenase n=1 Tax=Brachybacterium sp. Z12 TaxID=2759167 RepID=UPI00223B544B|nr:prephenate dehydrogenase [Brachybacterium sp. Z12]